MWYGHATWHNIYIYRLELLLLLYFKDWYLEWKHLNIYTIREGMIECFNNQNNQQTFLNTCLPPCDNVREYQHCLEYSREKKRLPTCSSLVAPPLKIVVIGYPDVLQTLSVYNGYHYSNLPYRPYELFCCLCLLMMIYMKLLLSLNISSLYII